MSADCSSGVSLLLEHNISWDWRNKYGQTALHLAAVFEDESTLRTLLENTTMGLDWQDPVGRTALHCACSAFLPRNIEALVEAGASTQLKDTYQKTPWQIICGNTEAFDPRLSRSLNEKLVTRKAAWR